MILNTNPLSKNGPVTLSGVPEGLDGLVLADIAAGAPFPVIHVARDDKRQVLLAEMLAVYSPDLPVLQFPAWDCLPYDRVSPNNDVASARVKALGALAMRSGDDAPLVILTTVSAILQRLPPAQQFSDTVFNIQKGHSLDLTALTGFMIANATTGPVLSVNLANMPSGVGLSIYSHRGLNHPAGSICLAMKSTVCASLTRFPSAVKRMSSSSSCSR